MVEIVNPLTPSAFTAPELATQANVAAYFIVVSLTIIIWDILHNLQEDWRLVFKERIRFATLVYFTSRTGALAYAVVKIVFLSVPIKNCAQLELVGLVLYLITTCSTAFLFYIRVCAVYNNNKFVVAFFGLTWLGVLGGSVTIIEGVTGTHLGPTPFCLNIVAHEYIVTSSIAGLINDLTVFAAITYKFGRANIDASGKSTSKGVSTFFNGDSLPAFSKAMLQDSQVYYLIAVTMNATVLIVFYAAASVRKSPIRVMFIALNTVLVSILACRVFRNQKLGRHKAFMGIASSASTDVPLQVNNYSKRHTFSVPSTAGDIKTQPGQIEVNKVVEWTHDYSLDHESKPSLHNRQYGDV
ncbi:hypothetical protein GALMADRAFT_87907 [Galerina marginata CBS 339.88]|uniref:DUF6533 domain-containing protein n=1 Tax=Galerina marginata (strain CBS 339.88) TaxID=685588 RepID=A0A067TU97_GALM3|nr:hypothetical protein GALMADRAFT_87907 [Galerina marginata CBS 339.88]